LEPRLYIQNAPKSSDIGRCPAEEDYGCVIDC